MPMGDSVGPVVAFDAIHPTRVHPDERDEYVDGALVSEPESQRKSAYVEPIQGLYEQDAQSE